MFILYQYGFPFTFVMSILISIYPMYFYKFATCCELQSWLLTRGDPSPSQASKPTSETNQSQADGSSIGRDLTIKTYGCFMKWFHYVIFVIYYINLI